MTEIEKIFNNLLAFSGKIGTVFMLAPLILAFINRKSLNSILKKFQIFCLFAFLIALLFQGTILLVDNFHNTFVPLLNKWEIHDMNFMSILAYLNHFGLLGWYFSIVIPNIRVAKIVKWVSIFLFCAAIINYLFIEGFRVYGIFNPTASAIFCFTLPLIHLWYLFNEDNKVPLTKNSYFWFSMGLLIPNMIGFFLHFAGEKIYGTDFILFCKISIGKCIFSIIGQILLAIGFYYSRYTKYLPKNTPSVIK